MHQTPNSVHTCVFWAWCWCLRGHGCQRSRSWTCWAVWPCWRDTHTHNLLHTECSECTVWSVKKTKLLWLTLCGRGRCGWFSRRWRRGSCSHPTCSYWSAGRESAESDLKHKHIQYKLMGSWNPSLIFHTGSALYWTLSDTKRAIVTHNHWCSAVTVVDSSEQSGRADQSEHSGLIGRGGQELQQAV